MEIKGKGNAVRWREEKNGNPKNMKIQRKKRKLWKSEKKVKSGKKIKKIAIKKFKKDKTLDMKGKNWRKRLKKTQPTNVEGR